MQAVIGEKSNDGFKTGENTIEAPGGAYSSLCHGSQPHRFDRRPRGLWFLAV